MIFGSKLQAARQAFEQATTHGDPSSVFFPSNSNYLESERASRLALLRAELMANHGARIEKILRLYEIVAPLRERVVAAYASRNSLIKRRKEYESAAYRAAEIDDRKSMEVIDAEIQRTKEQIAAITDQIAKLENDFQAAISVANACGKAFAASICRHFVYRGEHLSNVLGFDIY